MKKSVVALAVLGAFTSVAFAQSSVTLYGRIDQNMTYQDPGNLATIKGTADKGKGVMKINDGSVNGMGSSRLGIKGTEDLGSGLKAYFVLESQVTADTGGERCRGDPQQVHPGVPAGHHALRRPASKDRGLRLLLLRGVCV